MDAWWGTSLSTAGQNKGDHGGEALSVPILGSPRPSGSGPGKSGQDPECELGAQACGRQTTAQSVVSPAHGAARQREQRDLTLCLHGL